MTEQEINHELERIANLIKEDTLLNDEDMTLFRKLKKECKRCKD